MSDFDRKGHWEGVYQRKEPGEVSWYQAEPATSLRLIRAAAAAPSLPIIDLGGGASRLVDRLLADGFSDLTVLDIAASALAHAKGRLGARAGEVNWIEADVTAFTPPRPYAIWHDRAVFHFLTDPADRRAYLDALRTGLMPGGTLILAAFAIGGPPRCSDLPVEQYDAKKLMEVLGPEFELRESCEELHLTPAGKEQRFGWFVLVKRG